MGESFRINQGASTEEIRQKLAGFGRFSEVDIRAEDGEKNSGEYVVFSEVDIGERLRRFFFEDKKNIEAGRKKSQKHLMDLALRRDDIKNLLGKSVLEYKFWTASDLRQQLKTQTTIIRRDPQTDKFEIRKDADLKRGVIDAKLSEVKADTCIHWNFFGSTESESTANNTGKNSAKVNSGTAKPISMLPQQKNENNKTLTITCNYHPDENNLRDAYSTALHCANGHVVLSPIYDVRISEVREKYPDHVRAGIFDVQFDQNIRILLEETDRALRENKNITQVTIARGDVPDDQFLSRVLAQRAILDKENESASVRVEQTSLAMPDSLRHFFQSENAGLYVNAEVDESTPLAATHLSQVRVRCADPGALKANTMILSFESVDRRAAALAKSGLHEFRQIRDLLFDQSSLVYDEAHEIMTKTEREWCVRGLALPPGELPCDRLYAIQPAADNSMTLEAVKKFFIRYLGDLNAKTVIEIPVNPTLRQALWLALIERNSFFEKNNVECILAARDSDDIDRFLEEGKDLSSAKNLQPSPSSIQSDKDLYRLATDDDKEDGAFNYINNIQKKFR